MSEYGDFCREMRRDSSEKRWTNLEKSTKILRDAGVEFESHNDGVHLIIRTTQGMVNFYPSTGLYNGALSGRGVFRLLKDLENVGK